MRKIYYYSKWLNYIFWERVAESTLITESSLGIFRWIFGIALLLFFVPHFGWISQAPDVFFSPPYLSLSNFFTEFPVDLLFYSIDILIIFSALFVTLGVKTRLFNLILIICWFIGNNFKYSFGKIDHGDVMILSLLLCLNFSNWGTYYALIPDKEIYPNSSKKALAVFGVLLAFGMFTAGFEKALNWIDFDFSTNGFLSWFFRGYYDRNKTSLLAPTVLYLPKWIFEFADYTAVVFELSGFIALLSLRKRWLCWLLIACLFHLSNTLLLNIPFLNHFLVYLVFVDFSQFRKPNIDNIFFTYNKLKYFLSGLVFVLFFAHLLQKIHGQTLNFFTGDIYLYNSVIIWTFAAIVIFLNILVANNKDVI